MKITYPEIIRRGEQDLIEAIKEELDWKILEKLSKDEFSLNNVECKQGDIIVHDNEIAYKLDLEVKIGLSVLFDRDGNFLPLTSSNGSPEERTETDELIEKHDESDLEVKDSDDENELQAILQSNRDFWSRKSKGSDESAEESNTIGGLQEALKVNRDFWLNKSKKDA